MKRPHLLRFLIVTASVLENPGVWAFLLLIGDDVLRCYGALLGRVRRCGKLHQARVAVRIARCLLPLMRSA